MREFWLGFFGAVLGVLAALAMLSGGAAFLGGAIMASMVQDSATHPRAPLPDRGVVIEVDLRSWSIDDSRAGPAADPAARRRSAADAIRALQRAALDPSVDGVFILAGGGAPLHPAHGEEIAFALAQASRSGKPVVAHIQDLAPESLAQAVAAAGAGTVWASPETVFSLPAASSRNRQDLAILHRFNVALIERLRGLPADSLGERLSAAPLTAREALDAGLIDQVGTAQAARAGLVLSPDARLVDAEAYLQASEPASGTSTIAFIHLQRQILSGRAQPGDAGSPAFADTIAAAIDLAAGDDRVRAIVLRVDASDGEDSAVRQITEAIARAQASGKPVIASIGSTALAGGYSAIAAADRILAPAASMIGALGADGLILSAAFAEPGARTAAGPLQQLAQARYAALVEQVAEARDLPIVRVDELGRGQIWTGAQAVEFGLADGVGGLTEAVEAARALAGLSADEAAPLTAYPPPPSALDVALARLLELFTAAR